MKKEKIVWTPSMMGKKGGKQSVKSRFDGLTDEEISEKMRKVRLGKPLKSKVIRDKIRV